MAIALTWVRYEYVLVDSKYTFQMLPGETTTLDLGAYIPDTLGSSNTGAGIFRFPLGLKCQGVGIVSNSLQVWLDGEVADIYTPVLGSGYTAVRAATTSALPASTYATGDITASGNGALAAIDGVTLTTNDRLLVKNETEPLRNGIYFVQTVGDGSNPFVLRRATDLDIEGEFVHGKPVSVTEGTLGAGASYYAYLPMTFTFEDAQDGGNFWYLAGHPHRRENIVNRGYEVYIYIPSDPSDVSNTEYTEVPPDTHWVAMNKLRFVADPTPFTPHVVPVYTMNPYFETYSYPFAIAVKVPDEPQPVDLSNLRLRVRFLTLD